MLEAEARRRLAAIAVLQVGHVHPVGHGVKQRNFDLATKPALGATDQRLKDGLVGRHTGGDIAYRNTDPRRAVLGAVDCRKPGLGLNEKVVGLLVLRRAFRTIAGDRAYNQPWIFAPEISDPKPQPFQRAGRQVLDEYIGLRKHAPQQGPIVLRFEIKAGRFLAAIDPDEVGARALDEIVISPREITFRTLHLDHACPGISQLARCVGSSDSMLHRDNKDVGKVAHRPLNRFHPVIYSTSRSG